MVIVSCPLMKDKVIEIVEGIAGLEAKHIKTEGIDLYFETNTDVDSAIEIIKPVIKNHPLSRSLIIKVRKNYI